jgi:hypothetical protein
LGRETSRDGTVRTYLSGRGLRYRTILFPLVFAVVKANEAETEFTIVSDMNELPFGATRIKKPHSLCKDGV